MNPVESILEEITTTKTEESDYLGEDGLLYCGKCRTPKQLRLEKNSFFGDRPLPVLCRCGKERRDRENASQEQVRHLHRVDELKRAGFTDPTMQDWTFEHDSGLCSQTEYAKLYVERFDEMEKENIGYLLWGPVGTGKSYFAACIANALMEKEIPVRMTNFAAILNDLNAAYGSRNEYLEKLNRCRLLILDDFGMERGTEYALEQIYNVIDSRTRSGRPLIVTTNLSLSELQNPTDIAHARIYDRVLELCIPICFTGESMRRARAGTKMDRLKTMMQESVKKENPGNTI